MRGYTVFHNGGAVRAEFAVVSAFRRTREVRLKPDTTYYKHMKTAVSVEGDTLGSELESGPRSHHVAAIAAPPVKKGHLGPKLPQSSLVTRDTLV